jgi:hypothetical protein
MIAKRGEVHAVVSIMIGCEQIRIALKQNAKTSGRTPPSCGHQRCDASAGFGVRIGAVLKQHRGD